MTKRAASEPASSAEARLDLVLQTHAELGEALAQLDILAAEHAKAAERVTDLEGRLRGLARQGHRP